MSAKDVINEWLNDFETGNDVDVSSFAEKIKENRAAVDAIINFIDSESAENDAFDILCGQLLMLYRKKEPSIIVFVFQFLPVLIEKYLWILTENAKNNCIALEVLLLGIYNGEITDSSGNFKVSEFRIPTLSNASIYHDPSSLSSLGLAEPSFFTSYGRSSGPCKITSGPLVAIDTLTSQNRFLVLTTLFRRYNAHLANVHFESQESFCRMCSRLCKSGFHFPVPELVGKVFGSGTHEYKQWKSLQSKDSNLSSRKRVPLHSSLILEMLSGIYYTMFNPCALYAMQALEDIHNRCSYELMPDVLLVTNAIINSLLENASGHPAEGPMGLKVAPAVCAAVKGGLITSASLKIKKRPDDIPVRTISEDLVDGFAPNTQRSLTPVHEDAEDLSSRSSSRKKRGSVGVVGKKLLPHQMSESGAPSYSPRHLQNQFLTSKSDANLVRCMSSNPDFSDAPVGTQKSVLKISRPPDHKNSSSNGQSESSDILKDSSKDSSFSKETPPPVPVVPKPEKLSAVSNITQVSLDFIDSEDLSPSEETPLVTLKTSQENQNGEVVPRVVFQGGSTVTELDSKSTASKQGSRFRTNATISDRESSL